MDLAPELSLGATRSSDHWQEMPGNWDKLNTRALFPSANEWGIPDLPAATLHPARFVAYGDRWACRVPREGDCTHFFLDDYRFEPVWDDGETEPEPRTGTDATVWNKPERPMTRLQRVGMALTPDFSLYRNMPLVMQMWNIYRSRWCGAWMLTHGIEVIPTVSWSGPESFAFAFAGIAPGSVVAVSSVGVMRDREARMLFAAGLAELRDAIAPSLVLCYGQLPPSMRPDGIEVRTYPTRWERTAKPGDNGTPA